MATIVNDLDDLVDFDQTIKDLKKRQAAQDWRTKSKEYAEAMAFLHGAYFKGLCDNCFSHDEAFELLKIWSANATVKA